MYGTVDRHTFRMVSLSWKAHVEYGDTGDRYTFSMVTLLTDTVSMVSLCWKTPHVQGGVTVLKDTLSGWCHCVERHTFRMVSLCWKTYIQDGVTVLIDTRSALCHCVERHTFSMVALLTDIRLVWWEYSETHVQYDCTVDRHTFSMVRVFWETHVQYGDIVLTYTRSTWCNWHLLCWQDTRNVVSLVGKNTFGMCTCYWHTFYWQEHVQHGVTDASRDYSRTPPAGQYDWLLECIVQHGYTWVCLGARVAKWVYLVVCVAQCVYLISVHVAECV